MIVEQYAHTPDDAWTWRPAQGSDVDDMVKLAQTYFQQEIVGISQPDPLLYAKNLTLAIVRQHYNPWEEFISVARHNTGGELMAYTWVARDDYAWWSSEEMAAVRIAHTRMDMPVRTRLRLVSQQLDLWECWARSSLIPVVCSITMREDQAGFLELHRRHGFIVRGSVAYLSLDWER